MQNPNIHKLLAAAKSVKQSDGENWTAYCPIHEGSSGVHNNSLSITAPDDGRILVHCHNGCDSKQIVYALGLSWKDCFAPKDPHEGSKITAVYDYFDEDRVLRFQVCRMEPGKNGNAKDFKQRQPDGNGGWIWSTKRLQKFPYRLPELISSSGPVLVVEGEKQVDYLRSLGINATCNPGGAGKWLKSFSKYFTDRDVLVIPDCDPPNEKGKIVGAEHAKEVADNLLEIARSVRVIELPDAQPKWGLDDWLQKGGHTLQEFSDLANKTDPWSPESTIVTSVSSEPDGVMDDPLAGARKTLSDIGISYCAETESMDIEVFSNEFRKFSLIRDPGKLTYSRLLQIAGPLAQRNVKITADAPGTYTLNDVKNSIALISGSSRRGSEKLGQGIWRVADKTILVNGGHIAVLHEGKLEQKFSAVCEDTVFQLESGAEWFDFDSVAAWVGRSDKNWIGDAVNELADILRQWRYQVPDHAKDPTVCSELTAALIVSTFIQSFWVFRPMVFLLGESNCGKSTLFQLLIGEENNPLDKGLMGSLAIHSANQSAAGIRQSAENASRPVIVDEFEQSKNRKEILELLRGASRGSQTIRGSASQKAVTTKLAFMAWAASTESGLVKQVDQNRWIRIQLVTPPKHEMGNLKLPDIHELDVLRNKLIAAAICIGNDARVLVDALMVKRPKEIDHRVCQIFAVPAAVYSCMTQMDFDSSVWVFNRFLSTFDSESIESDQDITLEYILTAKLRSGTTERSVIELISHSENVHFSDDHTLETNGIKVMPDGFGMDGQKFVFFHVQGINRYVLRDTPIKDSKLDELLLRVPGSSRWRSRLGGRQVRGIRIPYAQIVQQEPSRENLFTEV